jgi:nucleoside-diphosphate-sugar epimerase
MSFKEKTGRIRNWCREHKTDIIITAAGIAGGAVVCYGVKKTVDITKVALENSRQRNEKRLTILRLACSSTASGSNSSDAVETNLSIT